MGAWWGHLNGSHPNIYLLSLSNCNDATNVISLYHVEWKETISWNTFTLSSIGTFILRHINCSQQYYHLKFIEALCRRKYGRTVRLTFSSTKAMATAWLLNLGSVIPKRQDGYGQRGRLLFTTRVNNKRESRVVGSNLCLVLTVWVGASIRTWWRCEDVRTSGIYFAFF